MDKRSLLFVLALTLALFAVHLWFSPKEQLAVTQTANTTEMNASEMKEIQKRISPVTSLPVVSLYKDAQGTQVATLAVKDNQQYLTFAWTNPVPQALYVKNGKKLDEVQLRTDANKLQAPLLYSSSTTEPLRVVKLLPNESFDLQLVSFPDNQKANVTLAEIQNQAIHFPLNKPESSAIALYKIDGQYLPYAIYNPNSFLLTQINEMPYFNSLVQVVQPEISAPANEEGEQFYVLENAYQQLVFSNIGGSLSDINLPLKSDLHPDSVIRPISFDRILKEQYPQTDWFPTSTYYAANPQGGSPILVEKRSLGGYYPLIRRSIFGMGGKVVARAPPRHYACNIVTSDQKAVDLKYTMKQLGKDFIEFEAVQSQRRITKRFSFPSDPKAAPYCFEVTIKVEGDARDLYLTSGIPEVELISGSSTPALKYRSTNSNNKSKVEQLSLPKNSENFSSFQPDWVCNSNGFLGLIIDPLTEIENGFSAHKIPGEFDATRLVVIDSEYQLYPADKYPGYEILLPLKNSSQAQTFRVFAGPFASKILKTVDQTYSNPATGYNPDYIASQSFHGWFAFISEPFAKFLFFLMNIFYQISRSWGVSIILLTLALRIMLYPLNAWSIKSTSKMQEIAPLVAAIQAKHKKDPKRGQLEVVALYREKGVNPFSGCLPILIQLPFLIGMFDLLKSTFELRGAVFIPHWIDNLTAPDVVFSWNYPIIFFGTEFHLLPILIGLVMYWQQKISSPLPKDKSLLTDQQKQQKMMGNIMVIVFTVMFYHFPSGLNIYWLFSILLGILQQWYMTRKRKTVDVK